MLIDEHTETTLGNPLGENTSSPLVNDQLRVPQFLEFRVVSLLRYSENRLREGMPVIHSEQEKRRGCGRTETYFGGHCYDFAGWTKTRHGLLTITSSTHCLGWPIKRYSRSGDRPEVEYEGPPPSPTTHARGGPPSGVGSSTTGPRRGRVAGRERLFVGFLHGVKGFKRRPRLIVSILQNSSLGFLHQRFAPFLQGRGTPGPPARFPIGEPGKLNATYRAGSGRGVDPRLPREDSTRSADPPHPPGSTDLVRLASPRGYSPGATYDNVNRCRVS